MLKNDAVIKFEPYKMVRLSGRVPKMLKLVDNDSNKSEYFIEPIVEGTDMLTAKIFYYLPTKFARQLLGNDVRYQLCHPERMVVEKYDGKRFGKRAIVVKACGDKPTKEDAANDEGMEDLYIKRAEKEAEEVEALGNREVPKHMAKAAAIISKQSKEVSDNIEDRLDTRLTKQNQAERKQKNDFKGLPRTGKMDKVTNVATIAPKPEKTTL